MKNQLQVTIIEIKKLGFVGRNVDGDKLNKPTRVYEYPILNGAIYFNPEEEKYTWYIKMNIGEASNHINLNIETVEDLLTILNVFKQI